MTIKNNNFFQNREWIDLVYYDIRLSETSINMRGDSRYINEGIGFKRASCRWCQYG